MHTISNKQAIANKKQQQEKRASSVKHEQRTFALEKPPPNGDFVRAFPNKCAVGKCIWKIEPLGVV
jgi:hypothetical protein